MDLPCECVAVMPQRSPDVSSRASAVLSSVRNVDAGLERRDPRGYLAIYTPASLCIAVSDVVEIERYEICGVGEDGRGEEQKKGSEEREHLEGVEENGEGREWEEGNVVGAEFQEKREFEGRVC